MRMYTIYLRRRGLDPERDIVILKEGFCWPAFLTGGLWALWHRMWWVALGLITAAVVLHGAGLLVFADKISPQVLILAYALLLGLLGQDVRAWSLERQGFVDCGPVNAHDRDTALMKYLEEDKALAQALYAGETGP